ncbi:MAG: HNH endonuclease [Planctomycetota bacterium]
MSLLDRFLEKVQKSADPAGCWMWIGSKRNEYGGIKVNGVVKQAHRVAYTLYHGEIPNGLVLLHSCDNQLCVNPDHLTPGKQLDNVQDMLAKGRATPFASPRSPIPPQQVAEMRQAKAGGKSVRWIAREWNVPRSTLRGLLAK